MEHSLVLAMFAIYTWNIVKYWPYAIYTWNIVLALAIYAILTLLFAILSEEVLRSQIIVLCNNNSEVSSLPMIGAIMLNSRVVL